MPKPIATPIIVVIINQLAMQNRRIFLPGLQDLATCSLLPVSEAAIASANKLTQLLPERERAGSSYICHISQLLPLTVIGTGAFEEILLKCSRPWGQPIYWHL